MREIKFRAWMSKSKNWANPLNIVIDGSGAAAYSLGGEINYHSDIEINLFTGLKDKNGKEIYEGDIVQWFYVDPMGRLNADTPNGLAPVGFENGQFVLLRKPESQPLTYWCKKTKGKYVSNYGNPTIIEDSTVVEVVGNIWENPELLK